MREHIRYQMPGCHGLLPDAGYRQILARFRWVTGSRDQVNAADKLVGERNVIFRARLILGFRLLVQVPQPEDRFAAADQVLTQF
jgi:hypothetical protein